jgi:hypothetical protein
MKMFFGGGRSGSLKYFFDPKTLFVNLIFKMANDIHCSFNFITTGFRLFSHLVLFIQKLLFKLSINGCPESSYVFVISLKNNHWQINFL